MKPLEKSLTRTALALLLGLALSLALPAWAADEKEKEEEAKPLPTPAYLALPSIVVNMNKGARHSRFEVQLMIHDKEKLSDIRLHQAALSNELIMLMSEEDGAVLKTAKGKEAFRQKALEACNQVLTELTRIEQPLRDLFFTTFFVR
ncbi:MAG: flagellar basal body-associated FliL family protein [Gammaproteobacteria bacterium SHHR-1]